MSNNTTGTFYVYALGPTVTGLFWALFGSVTLVGLVGNFLVIIAVVCDTAMRRSLMNLLLMNLAVADFGNAASCILDWSQILILRAPLWLLPAQLCPIVRYLGEMFLYASLLTQVLVCAERYIATVHPLHVRRLCTYQSLSVSISCVWLTALFCASPYAILYRRTDPLWMNGPTMCKSTRPLPMTFKAVECLGFYFIPLCLLTLLYGRIARLLWYDPGYLHESIRRAGRTAAIARIQVRRRVVKMLVCCVAVYFICYSPIQVLFLSSSIFRVSLPSSYFSAIMGLNAFCYASAACNPVIYTVFSESFRNRFREIVHLKTISKSVTRNVTSMGKSTHQLAELEMEMVENHQLVRLVDRERAYSIQSASEGVPQRPKVGTAAMSTLANFHSQFLLAGRVELL